MIQPAGRCHPDTGTPNREEAMTRPTGRPKGRPTVGDQRVEFKTTGELASLMDHAASVAGVTRPEWIRQMLTMCTVPYLQTWKEQSNEPRDTHHG